MLTHKCLDGLMSTSSEVLQSTIGGHVLPRRTPVRAAFPESGVSGGSAGFNPVAQWFTALRRGTVMVNIQRELGRAFPQTKMLLLTH